MQIAPVPSDEPRRCDRNDRDERVNKSDMSEETSEDVSEDQFPSLVRRSAANAGREVAEPSDRRFRFETIARREPSATNPRR